MNVKGVLALLSETWRWGFASHDYEGTAEGWG